MKGDGIEWLSRLNARRAKAMSQLLARLEFRKADTSSVPARARVTGRPIAASPAARHAAASKPAMSPKIKAGATNVVKTKRETKMKNERVPLFADLLDDEGSKPMRVEGFQHRTRDGGYVAATSRQAAKDSLPMRVEGWGHRTRDGRRTC